MMDLSPKFTQAIADEAVAYAREKAEPFAAICQSPIEIEFVTAFRVFAKMINYETVGPEDEPLAIGWAERGVLFDIHAQAKIENYRVDFLIGFGERHAVVECDGREFHHVSREQIERDRERDARLAELGYRVIRFPGAQIHAEPFRCAADVAMYLVTGQFFTGAAK